MKEKRLITSALPYVNNVPHLGNIIGCVLSGDVFARYCRLAGFETIYVCGTDEHGTATETKALEEGLTPQQICDKYHEIHKRIYDWFGCSFDVFGRTSRPEHTEITQSIFKKLYENGYITKGNVEQLWCPKCDKFLADRFVEGTCPYCGFERARGDQCDSCGKLLNATELLSPRCKVCGSQPQIKTTNHLFLDLPKLSKMLESWFIERKDSGFWTQNAKTVTEAWLKEGLKERAISRDLKWGVPIPLEGYEDKVFYVWFDAPIGYISITKSGIPDWEKWWKSDDVKLYQFMAKDNIPFHTIIFPASLLGTGEPWTTLYHIDSTEYLNYEDGKFSKSFGTGVFGDDAISTGIPPDVWRYYLLVNRPENSDTRFNWKDFQEKNNNELLANLGNLVNRTLTFIDKYFGGKVPGGEYNEKDLGLRAEIESDGERIQGLLEQVKIKEALREVMQIAKKGNAYFQENEPWKLIREESGSEGKTRAGAVINMCANIVKTIGVLINPFLPFTSGKIMHQLNCYKGSDRDSKGYEYRCYFDIEEGHPINKPQVLFRKLEDKEIQEFKQRFAGKRKTKETKKKDVKEKRKNEKKELKKFDRFALDLRVGRVEEVKDHPDAEKLMLLKVDLGTEKRQLVAGLKNYYTPEELTGKHIIVVCNLKPAKLRGIESQGMLLAGDDETNVKVLEAPESSPGMEAYLESIENAEEFKEISFEEFLEYSFYVDKEGYVICENVGKRLRTEEEFVKAQGLEEGAKVR